MSNIFSPIAFLVFMTIGALFFLKGMFHYLPMLREMRSDRKYRHLSSIFGFVVFAVPGAFTDIGNVHRRKFLSGVGAGALFISVSLLIKHLEGW
jgi:hypothetical protein